MPRTADDLAVVKSTSGTHTHVLDRRYAVLGKALCGARIQITGRPANQDTTSVSCKKCSDIVR